MRMQSGVKNEEEGWKTKLPCRRGGADSTLKASSGERHTGREEIAWLGSGYY